MAERIVVLGAGFGGINVALDLATLAGGLAEVTLVDRDPDYVMGLAKLWVATGARMAEESRRPRERLTRHGVDFVKTRVQGIDVSSKSVKTDDGSLSYDRLVIALGLDPDPSSVPGLAEHGINLYSVEGAQRVAQMLPTVDGDILIAVCAVPFKCPPAPYEAAMMIDDVLKARDPSRGSRIEVVTPEPRPMPILPPEAGERVIGLLAERGITFSPGRKLVAVEPGLARFEDGTQQRFDVLLAVPPHRPPDFLADVPGLTDASGLVVVDRETLTTAVPDVFALGDVAKVLSFTDLPIPRAGILAEGQAHVVATNIAAELRGETATARFDGRGYCFVEVGGGQALRADGEFLAQPHPLAHFADGPSPEGFAQKLAFEAERLEAWFGSD